MATKPIALLRDAEQGWRVQKLEIAYSVHGGWYVMATEVNDQGGSSTMPLWDPDDRVLLPSAKKALQLAAYWLEK